MAAGSSRIVLIIATVLYLTTVATSVSFFDLAPIAKEVGNAIRIMGLPKKTQDAFSKQYINVGGYSSNFIELLDSYKTMSSYPIRFNENEKLILTLSSSKDPLRYKVLTQLKYYRKMQEVQCTDYLILYNLLYDTNWDMQHIIQHVYNMIKMAYFGKFVIFAWLLKLNMSLEKPENLDHDEPWILQLTRGGMCDLEAYKKPLNELINMCVVHKYLEKKSCAKHTFTQLLTTCFNRVSEHDEFNTQLLVDFNNNESPLPFSVDYLYLGNIRRGNPQIEPITSTTVGWNRIDDLFQYKIYKITQQLSSKKWITNPFENIVFQQLFLDIVRTKLYCFVWYQLVAYQKVDLANYKYRLDYFVRLDYFMSLISDIVKFIHIEDKTLNEVLSLYSSHEKGKSNYEQNEKLLNTIKTAIENSMTSYTYIEFVALANTTEDDIKTELSFILFLDGIEKKFLEFGNFLKTTLDGLSFNFLLFFVNGSKNTELAVFP